MELKGDYIEYYTNKSYKCSTISNKNLIKPVRKASDSGIPFDLYSGVV